MKIMTFGKHADKPLQQVPVSYWSWAITANAFADKPELAESVRMLHPKLMEGLVVSNANSEDMPLPARDSAL